MDDALFVTLREHFDEGQILAIDQPASSAQTSELLHWHPVQPGLIEDLDKGHYFG